MFARGKSLDRFRGFTLLEMMIVISIIMILMAVAVPVYNQSIVQARESVLRSNLSTLRIVISQYTLDKQKAPQSLDDLVTGGLPAADSRRSHDPPNQLGSRAGRYADGRRPAGTRHHRRPLRFERHRQRRNRLQHLVNTQLVAASLKKGTHAHVGTDAFVRPEKAQPSRPATDLDPLSDCRLLFWIS